MSDEDKSAEAEADAILAELMGTSPAAEPPKAAPVAAAPATPAPAQAAPTPKAAAPVAAAPAATQAPAAAPKEAPAAPKATPTPAAALKAPAPAAPAAVAKPEDISTTTPAKMESDAVKPTPADAVGNAKIDAPQEAIDAIMEAGNEDAKSSIDMQEDEILNALNSTSPASDSDLERETLAHITPPALSLEERFQGKAREICYQVLNEVLEEQLQGEFVNVVKNKIKELLVLTLEEQALELIKPDGKAASEKESSKKAA